MASTLHGFMALDPLAQSVGALMRQTPAISPEDSLARAAAYLWETPFGVLPVTREGLLLGTVSESDLARSLAQGKGYAEPVEIAIHPDPPTIHPDATGAEALRRFDETGSPWLVVVDASGFVLGVIGAAGLYPRPPSSNRLHLVGGMATPFGVYLTTGAVRAGPGDFALVCTGALLFSLFFFAVFAGEYAAFWLGSMHASAIALDWVRGVLPMALFLFAVRTIPLAGTHAAEHKVVHAIERGEPLELEIVRRMPRVHPRCGTNLAVGASIFFGLSGWEWTEHPQLRVLVAAIVTLFTWRPLGNFLQLVATTRPPSDKQIMGAIRSGRALLDVHARSGAARSNLLKRLYLSGLFHVLLGSFAALGVVELVAWTFNLSLPV